jgi:uncharacterized membrane protein YeaQ/YmgE (transglycosylase-associated protein family)
VEWIIFLIPFIATVLKVTGEREAKTNIGFIILLILASTLLGVVLAYIDAFLTQATFTLTTKNLITYLFDAFIGAIIIPIAQYLISIKIE